MSKLATTLASIVCTTAATAALAQTLPASQPNYLQIVREEIRVGHAADHLKVEAGWPAAYEQAKGPYMYIGLASMTGRGEAWFVQPFESHKVMEDALKRDDDPGIAPTLARLSKADSDHISGSQTILAMARKDLSYGAYPDTAKQRFYEITLFRVRPGHSRGFETAAKAYAAAAKRSAPNTSCRVYEVMAGMPSPTFLIFSSVTSYAEFDRDMANSEAIGKGMTDEERGAMEKFSAEGVINTETIRFRLDPTMSYVTKEVRAQDPAFWMPNAAVNAAPARPSPRPADQKPAKR
jgi:hypothetical protein